MNESLEFPSLQSCHAPIPIEKQQQLIKEGIPIKIFSLLNEQSNQSQFISITFTNAWLESKFEINLYSLFATPDFNEHISFKILDPKKCEYKQIEKISMNIGEKECFVKDNEFWEIIAENYETVEIKYTNYQNSLLSNTYETWKSNPIDKKTHENESILKENAAFSADQADPKGKRSGERTIQEVIMLVQKWRKFEGNNSESMKKEKKVSLMQAANKVGVSKKSLDDYYYQLRTGEKLGFDFMSNLDHKIGVLRNYIKIQFPKRKVGEKNGKHGKKLNIIQNFTPQVSPSIPTLFEDERMDKMEERVTSTGEDLIFDAKISLSLDDLFIGLEDNALEDCIHVDIVYENIKCIYEPML